ncbi:hypothetical protein [Flavobacterium sp. K5-23]|uniref:hypothetical protein n=1 Tax=Flavobacterium sp. K5-23 TaxID=2746225 RepID=UPI00200BE785|nr:hypothetical protein [Flavobacterium sp. K5-23]UQD55759.1 aspartate ammonia-lyase [Flavobacterium sp. K5-23]
MTISRNLSGIAGTYYVAAELSRRGYIALITLKNTAGVDILASSEDSFKSIGIQVKTNQHNKRKGWLLSKKNEDVHSDNLIFVFVNMKKDGERPNFYIISSVKLAEEVRKGHVNWLETPGKNGKEHNDNPMRMFGDKEEKHLENWGIITDLLDDSNEIVSSI